MYVHPGIFMCPCHKFQVGIHNDSAVALEREGSLARSTLSKCESLKREGSGKNKKNMHTIKWIKLLEDRPV
jgi:hypothetical protein